VTGGQEETKVQRKKLGEKRRKNDRKIEREEGKGSGGGNI
jgi:hypothetical protein